MHCKSVSTCDLQCVSAWAGACVPLKQSQVCSSGLDLDSFMFAHLILSPPPLLPGFCCVCFAYAFPCVYLCQRCKHVSVFFYLTLVRQCSKSLTCLFFSLFIDISTGTSRLICRWKMDLLVSLCVEIFSSAFLLSPSPCVTDRPYWAITGVTPSFVWGQFSHRFGAMCILRPPHYLVCTGTKKNRTLSCSSSSTPPPVPSPHPFLRFPSVKWTLQQAGNI